MEGKKIGQIQEKNMQEKAGFQPHNTTSPHQHAYQI